MKWTSAITILATTMMLGLTNASAQTVTRVTIPFSFHVGSASLPAGSYEVRPTDRDVLLFYKRDGSAQAYVLAAADAGSTAAPTKLVFSEYGNQYFLRETLRSNGESLMTFGQSKLEKEIRAERASLPAETRTVAGSE